MPKPETRPILASGTAAPSGVAGELAHRFDQAQKAAGRARLPDRELAARGVVRKAAVGGERVRADEVGALALGAEAEVLHLHHADHRVVVVGLHEVDVVRPSRPPWRRARRHPSPSRRDTGSDPPGRRCGARWWRAGAPREVPARCATSSRQTRKASAPAQGMTQSNRWMGSEMARAPRYSSSVSGFFIRACGNFSALARWATQILPKSSRVAP